MSAITASASSTTLTPLQKLQQELQAELTKGTVAAGDSEALSSALAEIDKSLQSDSSSQSGGSKPGDIKSKIDELIDAQVASGKLTTDQATELQGVFKATFAGGPGRASGPPPSDTDTSASNDGTGVDPDTALQKLLEALKESLAASSANSYSATGSSTSTTGKASFSALLVDYTS